MLELVKTREQVGASLDVVEKAKAEGRISEEVADIYKRFTENGFQSESNSNGVTLDEFAKMNEYADVVGFALEVREGIKGEYTAIEQQRLADEKLQNEFNAKTPEEQQRILESAPRTAAEAVSDPLGRDANTLEGLRQQRERSALAPQGRELSAETKEKVSEQIESKTGDLVIDGNTVVTEKGSGKVTFDFSTNKHTTLETMTSAEKAALRLARVVAASTKSNIKIESEFTGRHKNENGYYNPITHTLHINLSGEHSAVWVMSHELTHHLQTMNERAYNDLRDVIRDELSKQDVTMSDLNLDYDRDWLGEYLNKGMNLWEALNALEDKRYDEEYKGNDRAERVEEEVVARCCESFLARESFMREMAKKHLKSARSIAQFLQKMRNDIASLQEAARSRNAEQNLVSDTSPEDTLMQQYTEIEQIAGLWTRGVNEAVQERKAAKAQSEAKAAIMEKNGYRYVQTSRNVITGNDSSKWGQQVTDYINNEIRHGKDVIVYTKKGVPLTITKDTAGKAAFRNYVQMKNGQRRLMTDAEYAVKLRAETHIDELAKVSDGKKTRPGGVFDEKGHVFAKDGFNYREAYFLDGDTYTGDNYYVVTMSVGKNGRIQTIYNVGKVEKTDLPTKWGQAPDRSKTETEDTVSKDSVASKPDSVKMSEQNKASISDREYLDLAQRYESGDKSVEADLRKAVDAAAKATGYTVEAYHGTPNGTFTVFRGWQYFTQSEEYANVYQGRSASSISVKTTENNPKTYHVFLDTGNAFDTRRAKYRRIFEEEFYRKYGNGTPLSNRNLPDWTDGEDLVEFFDENGYEYDSIYLDEGGTGGYGDAVNDRGVSIMIRNSSQVKSADLITKDDNDNIIPLSERFNENEEDIRRSIMDKEFRLESSEWFDAEKYEKMSEKEREEYRKHLRDLDIRKQARERQREIDRNRQYRSDIVRILKKGNDRIVKLLANPTENAHVPIQLAQAVVSAETTVLSNIDKAGGSIIEEINARADSCSKNIDSEPDEENSSRLLFCRYCGFKLLDNSEFCSHCGKKVR